MEFNCGTFSLNYLLNLYKNFKLQLYNSFYSKLSSTIVQALKLVVNLYAALFININCKLSYFKNHLSFDVNCEKRKSSKYA